MDTTRCRNCPHFKSYYHGFGVGSVMFSHRCWWTGRDPADMKDEECHLTTEPGERTMAAKEMRP